MCTHTLKILYCGLHVVILLFYSVTFNLNLLLSVHVETIELITHTAQEMSINIDCLWLTLKCQWIRNKLGNCSQHAQTVAM